MTNHRLLISIFLVILICLVPTTVLAQSTTDVIRDYRIDLQPQDDASLINTYTINWCVISNALGPLTDFYVGMPNENYQIMDFSGDAGAVRSADQGANTQVSVILAHSISANECVTVTFRIHQMGIAHRDEAKGEIGFQFTPGWFDEIQVEHLQVTWRLPADGTQLKSISPEPKTRDASQAVWEKALQPGDKLTINLLYDQAAFPNFGKQSTPVWPLQGGGAATTAENTAIPDASGGSTNNQTTVDSAEPLLGGIIPIGTVICVCAFIIFIFIILVLISILSSGVRSYRGGGTIGGPRSGGGGTIFFPPSRPSGGGGIFGGGGGGSVSSPPSRSGGGGGLFGGRGSSCACVSCACACACAGGGRAGCSRKGFDISGLLKKSPAGKEQ
jgi:hypothetical protein